MDFFRAFVLLSCKPVRFRGKNIDQERHTLQVFGVPWMRSAVGAAPTFSNLDVDPMCSSVKIVSFSCRCMNIAGHAAWARQEASRYQARILPLQSAPSVELQTRQSGPLFISIFWIYAMHRCASHLRSAEFRICTHSSRSSSLTGPRRLADHICLHPDA